MIDQPMKSSRRYLRAAQAFAKKPLAERLAVLLKVMKGTRNA